MDCLTYLGGITPDEYLLKSGNVRYTGRPPQINKRRLIMRAQHSPNDLALYLEGAIPLPADDTTTNVITYTVPSGMDVIVTNIRNTWSGTGFANGGGALRWRVVVGGGFVWGRGQMGFENTASTGWNLVGSGGVFIFENQQIQVQAITEAGSNAVLGAGNVECQVEGWFIPRL